MDAARIALVRRLRQRALFGAGAPPKVVLRLCDDILEMHAENRLWDRKWHQGLKKQLAAAKRRREGSR